MTRILYLTDRYKVSSGYEPAFATLLRGGGLKRNQVVVTDIYNLVESPLKKYKANDTIWRFDVDKLDKIKAAMAQRVRAIRPDVIVISCPALLGVLTNGDIRSATIDKLRGGVYYYGEERIPTIVTYPITAIHQRIDERILKNDDGETDTHEPYKVQQGKHILAWDWQKVGRFAAGKQRVLPAFRYSICRTLEDCYAARSYLAECVLIGVDIETGCWPPQITCSGYAGLHRDGSVHTFVIPFYDEFASDGCFWESEEDHAVAWSVMADINANSVPKTMQGGMYDSAYFIRDLAPPLHYVLDLMFLWWSMYMEMPKTLDFICSVLLDDYQYWKDDIKGDSPDSVGKVERSMERYWRYNGLDCRNTLFGTLYMCRFLLRSNGMQWNFTDAMSRMYSALAMSMRGVKADFERRDEHRIALEAEREEEENKLRWMIDDPEFNYRSPAQKNSLLYEFFGLPPRNDRGRLINPNNIGKGKANTPSSGAIPLKMAKYAHPFIKAIIDQMEKAMVPDKQISNVCNMKISTDRFRSNFNAIGTETTRLSSKGSAFWDGGNAQNIRGTYRDWLVADRNHIFIDVDYSQSDDVFVAYESEDPDKIELVESGRDGHAVNGELFFGKPYDEIVAGKKAGDPLIIHPITGIRQLSKKVVHGTNFQMAAFTLYITMGREAVVAAAKLLGHATAESWNQEQLVQLCGQFMAKYRRKYKRLNAKEWYGDIAKELLRSGTIVNAFGTSRKFLSDPRDNGTQREATAFIGQSGTAGNMNRVMREIDHGFIPKTFRDGPNPDANDEPRKMTYASHGCAFQLQVHDNFVMGLNLKHPKWHEAAHNLLYVMDRPVIIHGRTVRVRSEASLGLRWGKKMLDWDGDMRTLDSVVTKLTSKQEA